MTIITGKLEILVKDLSKQDRALLKSEGFYLSARVREAQLWSKKLSQEDTKFHFEKACFQVTEI